MQPPSRSVNRLTLVAWLQQEFHPSRLIPSLTAALITGTIEVIYAISFVALIFSGDLAPYISTGIGLALFTSISISLILALGSSSPGIVSGTQEATAIILGVMAAAISAQFSASTPTGEVLPTIIVALALTSILTGICCFLLGWFKLGDLVRFIPYPVVGGFLAGTGWLLVLGSLSFMTDLALPGEQFLQLVQPQILLQWVPGCGFGILLLLLLRRYHHFLLMPGLVFGAIILFYIALFSTHTSIADAQGAGLLLKPFPSGSLWQPLSLSTLTQANGALILSQLGQMVAVMLITVISILLNATGIELAIEQDLDLNRELRVTGIANLVSGLGGGIIGFHRLGLSILSYGKLGAKSRMVGVFIAAGMAIILFANASLISLFPKPVLGGVTLLLGLDLLVEWGYDAWFKLSKTDYFIVILILFVIATVGFLEGVGVGLAVAIALFVISYSRVSVSKYTLSGASYQSHAARSVQQQRLLQAEGNQIYILELQGFLFFGTANTLLNQIRQQLQRSPLKFIVFSFRTVTGLDSSAMLSFTKLKQIAKQHEFSLVFTNLSPTIQRQLQLGDILKAGNPRCQVFPDLDRGIEWCENQILETIPQRRRRSLPLALQLNERFTHPDHVSDFMTYLQEQDLEPGETLFHQGEPADSLYLIELGQITLQQQEESHQPRRLQSLGAANLVGELDFFSQTPHQTSAVVDQNSTLYGLSYEAMQRMRHDQPEVAATFQEFVISLLRDRLVLTYKEVSDLLK